MKLRKAWLDYLTDPFGLRRARRTMDASRQIIEELIAELDARDTTSREEPPSCDFCGEGFTSEAGVIVSHETGAAICGACVLKFETDVRRHMYLRRMRLEGITRH